MIALHGSVVESDVEGLDLGGIWRIRKQSDGSRTAESNSGVARVVVHLICQEATFGRYPFIRVAPELNHLSDHDLISFSSDKSRVFVLWRNESHSNSILLTEQCDNYCIMCSQPPKAVDDSHLFLQAMDLIAALRYTPVKHSIIGITGGEPTLYGQGFIKLLEKFQSELPSFDVHVLSNGRKFSDELFCTAVGEVLTERMVIAIPVYGVCAEEHDTVVGSEGAFYETVIGIHNLIEMGALVEIRVVLQRALVGRINAIADFIARNLSGAVQVSLMGLELMGFARSNFAQVWADPLEYASELVSATRLLAANSCNPRIYNHQLCVLPPEIRQFAVSSISDWKQEFDSVCDPCAVKSVCGGFFSSATRRVSAGITPLRSFDDPGSVIVRTNDDAGRVNLQRQARRLRITSVPNS